jgi:predicted glycosyltransferase
MSDYYYSKKLKRYFTKRLDFLIYAHDGRGLGHASRSIAICMALRRLFPERRVLFISGNKNTHSLIGLSPLDWIKLPSYETTVKNGVSKGKDGDSNFYKSVLGNLRSELVASIVRIFKPRCVLVDHAPAGKKEELVSAMELNRSKDTLWVLGLRGIPGDVPDLWSDKAAKIFNKYYHAVLWYGDKRILGDNTKAAIKNSYQTEPIETGYVSRMSEFRFFMEKLASALKSIGPSYGKWRVFVPRNEIQNVKRIFQELKFCLIEEVSDKYMISLLSSKVSVVYAGYNSLMDIIAAKVPSVVIIRGMADGEQEAHLDTLTSILKDRLSVLPENAISEHELIKSLEKLITLNDPPETSVNINGAEFTAKYLEGLLSKFF